MTERTRNTRSNPIRYHASRQRGFSVVEVLMTLVLLALGAALAIPSYKDMMAQRQVSNGAEQLATFINTAQRVAVETNEVVTVSYSRMGAPDWCIGAASGEQACDCTQSDPAASGYCQIASQPFVMNKHAAGDLDLMYAMEGDGAYAFDPVRGRVLGLDDSMTLELRSSSEAFGLNLLVDGTGKVILCSNDSAHPVPGYEGCPVSLAAN
jgi:prepilin-type N-terminal cleavage/methylation domain-containing protein